MPRKIESEVILQKAAELFAGRDFHAVQMDDVASATGVAKGTLYNRFRSKDDLYAAILRQRLSRLAETLESSCGDGSDPWKDLRNFLRHWESFMCDHPHFYLLLRKSDHLALSLQDAQGRMIWERIRMLLQGLIAQGVEQGRFRDTDAEVACDAILGMAEGCLRARIAGNGRAGAGADCVLDLLRRGLASDEGDERA